MLSQVDTDATVKSGRLLAKQMMQGVLGALPAGLELERIDVWFECLGNASWKLDIESSRGNN